MLDGSRVLSERPTAEPEPGKAAKIRRADVVAFGPHAERWAARLSSTTSLVLADGVASAEALEEATQRRRRAPVLTAPLIDEPRGVIARRLAPLVVERAAGESELRSMFDRLAANSLQLDDVVQSSLHALDQQVKTTLRDLYFVGVTTVVRSHRQAAFLGSLFNRYRPGYIVLPGVDHDVPAPQERAGGINIVIWAPHSEIGALSIYIFALAQLRVPIVIISNGQVSAVPGVRIASLTDAGRELRAAALIVDTTLSDPASAVALAAWKIPLVVASSSGADEFLDAVRQYDAWSWRSILGAVCAARSDNPTTLRAVAQPSLPLSVPDRETAKSGGPLVTIVVPTFDRLSLLPSALDSLAAQSYANIEILVVNDSGPPVGDIVARYPQARCITNAVNCGVLESCNVGIANARGEFIGFLADDDMYYYDHVERLVAALEQSGGNVAHANALTRFVEVDSHGILKTSGNAVLFGSHLDVTEALWWGFLGYVLVRRSVFDEVGTFDAKNAVADYEMFVRLSRSFDFIHVDQVTFEWRYRTDGSTLTHNVGTAAIADGLREIFERYPSGGDARVEQGRALTLSFIHEHKGLPYWEPPLRLSAAENIGAADR